MQPSLMVGRGITVQSSKEFSGLFEKQHQYFSVKTSRTGGLNLHRQYSKIVQTDLLPELQSI